MPCLHHHIPPSEPRRRLLKGIGGGAAALALGPLAAPALALPSTLFVDGELQSRMARLFDQAGGEALGQMVPFRLTPKDLPWAIKLMEVKPGQAVSFFTAGRWYLWREQDLWVEPGFVLHARVDGGPMYNPAGNTGTFLADRGGRLEIARSVAEWANADGEIWTPVEAYQQADGLVEGVAIAWNGEGAAAALEGVRKMLSLGDVGGILADERDRLLSPPETPAGWKNHYSFGEAGIFSLCGTALDGRQEMCCHTHKNVSILQKDINVPLGPGLKLDWHWLVSELPSAHGEDTLQTHDYLSIGIEFDDGQDITYLWSVNLPEGHAFRCPIPGWDKIETHVVQRSGREGLGKWSAESRDVATDYATLIQGPATRAVRVWLLGVSVFQRRTGTARFAEIAVESDGRRQALL